MKELKKPKLFIFDSETLGLDYEKNQILTLFGMIVNGDTLVIEKTIDLQIVQPMGVPYCVDPVALRINKIDLVKHHFGGPAKENTKICTPEEADRFISIFLEEEISRNNRIPMATGWNVNFDVSFLKQLGGRSFRYLNKRVLDLQSLVSFLCYTDKLTMEPGSSLVNICEHFTIPTTEHHNAEYDVKMTYQLLKIIWDATKDSNLTLV